MIAESTLLSLMAPELSHFFTHSVPWIISILYKSGQKSEITFSSMSRSHTK